MVGEANPGGIWAGSIAAAEGKLRGEFEAIKRRVNEQGQVDRDVVGNLLHGIKKAAAGKSGEDLSRLQELEQEVLREFTLK